MGCAVLLLLGIAGFFALRTAVLAIKSGFKQLIDTASTLDTVIIVALISGAVSIFSVFFTSVFSKYIEYQNTRQKYLAEKREKPYCEFVAMFYKVIQNAQVPGFYSESGMKKDVFSFSQELTLWGSKNVVKKWVQFRKNSTNPDATHNQLRVLEGIMNQMRKDMGTKRVEEGNLLSFFFDDIDSILKKK